VGWGRVLLRRPGEETEGGSSERAGSEIERAERAKKRKERQRRGGWVGERREGAARAVDVGTSVSRCEGRNRSLPGSQGAGRCGGGGAGGD